MSAPSDRARLLEESEDPRAVSWWAWHDSTGQEYASQHYASYEEALEACAAWVYGESDVGPARDGDGGQAIEVRT